MARSQNGWPALPTIVGTAVYTIPGTKIRVRLRKGHAGSAAILLYVAARWHTEVEPLVKAHGIWGWAYRKIRAGVSLSNHSSATAIDLNASDHPLAARGTFTVKQLRALHRIRDDVNAEHQVIRLGQDYVSRADGMHVEIVGTPAQVRAAVRRLAIAKPRASHRGKVLAALMVAIAAATGFVLPKPAPAPTPVPTPSVTATVRPTPTPSPTVKPSPTPKPTAKRKVVVVRSVVGYGSRGHDCRAVQHALRVHVDGDCRTLTVRAIGRVERAHRLRVDGTADARVIALIADRWPRHRLVLRTGR